MGTKKSVELYERSENRQRFFIALLPPEKVAKRANEIKAIMRDRYNTKAAFRSPPHITLRSPFTWPLAQLPELTGTLRQFAAGRPAIPVTLDGFGAFEPHAIYINVAQSDRLMALQCQLLTYLESTLGLAAEGDRRRAFVPHMTVAFRDLKPSLFRQARSDFQHEEIHFDYTVSQLTLLIYDGQQWLTRESYPFASPHEA